MIHASKFLPKLSPLYADSPDIDLDRVQDLTATTTINRTKVREVGNPNLVGWRKNTPNITATMKQFEYGGIKDFVNMANKGASVNTVQATDFTYSAFDIMGFQTNDNGTFLGTIWYPQMRLSSFDLNIADPQNVIERTFNFMGNQEVNFENNSAYVVRQRYVLTSNANNQTIVINSPTPQPDPDQSGEFLLRVVRCPANGSPITTALTWGIDWSYDGVQTLTINQGSTGDVIWVWYAAASYIPGQVVFTPNTKDVPTLTAECASILLINNQYVYRLQSIACNVAFTRKDIREIGNLYIVAEGVDDINTKVTLGRILETFTIEEYLRGVAGTNPGRLDPYYFNSNFKLVIKLYTDSTKTVPALAYEFPDLAPTKRDQNAPVNNYVNVGVELSGQNFFVTSNFNAL